MKMPENQKLKNVKKGSGNPKITWSTIKETYEVKMYKNKLQILSE